MPRGDSPKSKANLSAAKKRQIASLKPGTGQKAATEAAARANRMPNEVHDLFAEGQELHGLTVLAGEAGSNLATMIRRERKEGEINPALTARIDSLRKLINDILALRAQVSSDAPLLLLADELAKRIKEMRVDESSPEPPDPEPDPDAED